jgi:chromosome partitioning protein
VKVVATYSVKGGVGKTTAATNVAAEAARAGVRVLLWDLDPQGAATYLLRTRPKLKGGSGGLVGPKGDLARHIKGSNHPALHVVPADFSLRHLDLHLDDRGHPDRRLGQLLDPPGDDYDLALLDCPPSISLATESVVAMADALLVPVVPATLAHRTLEHLARLISSEPDPPVVLPFLSMVDRRRKHHQELAARLREDWPAMLPTPVPAAAVVERMGAERAPVVDYARTSAAAAAFRGLWNDLAARLWPATAQ